jgi:hypothetical protein
MIAHMVILSPAARFGSRRIVPGRVLALTAIAVTLSVSGAATAARSGPGRPTTPNCEARAKHYRGTIIHAGKGTSGGAIYEAKNRHGVGHLYVCAFAGGKIFDLGEGYSADTGWGLVVFAGHATAVELTFRENPSYLVVVDLQTGKRLLNRNLHGSEGPSASGATIGRIVLKRDGAAAWTEEYMKTIEGAFLGTSTYDVIEHDRHGTKVLDDTHTTKPRSLNLTGSTLRWTDGTAEGHTATLN